MITKDECKKRLDRYDEDTPVYMMDLDGDKVTYSQEGHHGDRVHGYEGLDSITGAHLPLL